MVRIHLRPLFEQASGMPVILEMIIREPNGEPKLMVILSVVGLCEASRSTGTPHSAAS